MHYKRNSGKFKSLILVAVMAALVMALGMPGVANAAPQVWLSIPGNSGGSDTAVAQKYAVVFYNDSASSITVTQVDITHDDSSGTGWGGTPTVTSPASTWSVPSATNIRWIGSVSVPAHSAQEFRCSVVSNGTGGASNPGTAANVTATVTATGGPYTSSSLATRQSSSGRASKLNGYLAASTANNNASPIYLQTNSGGTFAAGATVNFIYQVWTNGNGAGARYIVAACGSGSEVNITLPAGWSQPTNFTVPSIFNTPTTSGSVGTGWTIHMVQNASTASFQTEQFYNFQFSSNAPTDRATDSVEPITITYGAINSADIVESGTTSACGSGTYYTTVSVKTGAAVYVAAGTQNDTTVGALTSTGATDSTISVQAAFTGDDNNDNALTPNGDIQINNSGWTDLTDTAKGSGVYTASASSLLPGTSYSFQANFSDNDGVSGTNPATASLSTTYNGIGVGTVTLGTVADNSVVVNAPVDAASDDDNNATVQYQYYEVGVGPWTDFGSAVAAKSNTSMNITGLSPNTSYDFRVIWYDGTIYNSSTKATLGTTSYTSNTANTTTAYDGTTVGALTRTAISSTTIDLSAAFSGDANTDNSVVFEWDTVPTSGGWSTNGVGSPVLGSGAWTVQISGLTELTDYQFRVTFTDADGIYGTNPATHTDTTPSACDSVVDDCMDCHSMPPVAGSHQGTSHMGDATRKACAVCHYNYAAAANVTSVTKWTTGHTNDYLDVYTSAGVNGGMRGGGYKGYYNASSLWDGWTANSNNKCTNTYCHGNESPVWGTSGSLTCTTCHDKPPVDVGSHGKHSQGYIGYFNQSDTANYNFGCFRCHPESQHAKGPASADSAAFVVFSDISSVATMGGTYNVGTSQGNDIRGFKWSNATCTNALYCHSNGAGQAANTTPTWGTPMTGCNNCHNDATNLATNTHDEHINNVDTNLANFGCVTCHNATVDSDTNVSNKANHVNGEPTLSFAGGGTWNGTNCSNTACHTNGAAVSPTDLNPAWGGAAIGCNGCHGTDDYYTDINGMPDYKNITGVSPVRNSHYVTAHVSAATDCVKCHSDTVDAAGAIKASSLHLDGSRDVNLTAAGGGTWNGTTCSGTSSSCHQGITPEWGGTLTCYDCHIDTGAIGTENDDYTYGSPPKATINELEWQNAGHGRQTASGNYPYTGNTPANFPDCTTNCHTYTVDHNDPGGNYFRLTNNGDTIALCTGCHSTSTTNHHNETVVDTYHPNPNAIWSFVPKCVDCHDPHGDNGGITTNQYNAAMMHSAVNSAGSNSIGAPTGGTTTAVDFPTGFPGGSFVWDSFVDSSYPYNGLCQVCHDNADNVIHFYKTNGGYNSGHNTGIKCDQCHSHPKGFAGVGDCKGCHAAAQGARRSIQTDFEQGSHHIAASWASITKFDCVACHAEGNFADGSTNSTYHTQTASQPVDLKQWTGAFPSAGNNGTFTVVSYTAGSSANSVLTPFCLSCHNDTNKAATPFSDGKTPTAYAWDYNSVGSKYSNSGTTPWGKFDSSTLNVVPADLVSKAYSPHGNATNNERVVTVAEALGASGADALATSNVQCYDCHNAHSSTISGGTSYTSGNTDGGIIKKTGSYTPTPGGSSGTKNAYSASSDLCFDCHIGDDGTAPNTYTSYGIANGQPIQAYYERTGTTWNQETGNRWSTNDVWKGSFAYKDGNFTGGHLGASSTLDLGSPATSIGGNCVRCHDPHGVAATVNYTRPVRSKYTGSGADPVLSGTYSGTTTASYIYVVQMQTATTYRVSRDGGANWFATGVSKGTQTTDNGITITLGAGTYATNDTWSFQAGLNEAYMVPALKGTWMHSPYKEDRAPRNNYTSDTGTGDSSARLNGLTNADDLTSYVNSANPGAPYGVQRPWDDNSGGTSTSTTGRYCAIPAPRANPDFKSGSYVPGYNVPLIQGDGFGQGPSRQYGSGGTSHNGWNAFFIDENTFGTGLLTGRWTTACTPVKMTDVNADATPGNFAGLCLQCHTWDTPSSTGLKSVSSATLGTGSHALTTFPHESVSGLGTITVNVMRRGENVNGTTYQSAASAGENPDYTIHGIYSNNTNDNLSGGAGPGGRVRLSGATYGATDASASANSYNAKYYRWGFSPRSGSGPNPQTTAGSVQGDYHQFPCSKCHTPHTSRLPRLMKTNCLDNDNVGTAHTTMGYVNNGTTPNTTGSQLWGALYRNMACHSTKIGAPSYTNGTYHPGGWNTVTPW